MKTKEPGKPDQKRRLT